MDLWNSFLDKGFIFNFILHSSIQQQKRIHEKEREAEQNNQKTNISKKITH